VTAHDGFTLADLVSYDHKKNHANGEDGRDGTHNNRSWNSGVEGPTDDPAINTVRKSRARSILATLFLSQGVPMLLAGDELGRTQLGNNNAYAQDNEISWLDWEGVDQEMLDFVRRLVRIRSSHRVFRRRRWFEDRRLHGEGVRDIGWFRPDGTQMSDEDWKVSYAKSLGVYLNGSLIPGRGEFGEQLLDDSFLVLFNSGGSSCEFTLPRGLGNDRWVIELVTTPSDGEGSWLEAGETLNVDAWAMILLRQPREDDA
jgi:glycogen operon protein